MKNHNLKHICFFSMSLVLLLFSMTFTYAWYDTSWEHRKLITIDSTKVSGTHTNFPIIVDIIDSELSTGANSNGSDIMFTDSNGETLLDFELARYDSSTGQLVAWVEVPNVNSLTNEEIYMYYGNTLQTTSLENPTSLWSDYKNVWHLIEDTLDSTGNVDAMYTGETETFLQGDSHTNRGFEFDGSQNKITNSNGSYFDFISIDEDFSLSFWFEREDSGVGAGDANIVYLGTSPSYWNHGFRIWTWGGDTNDVTNVAFALSNETNIGIDFSSSFIEPNNFANYVIVHDSVASNIAVYVDGVLYSQTDLSSFSGDFNTGFPFTIGGSSDWIMDHETNAGTVYYDVKLLNSVLSEDEIATRYTNQDSSDTFVSLSSEEEAPDTTGPTISNISIDDGDVIDTSSATISFDVTDDILVDTVTLNFDGKDVLLSKSGDTYSYEATNLENGEYSFTISANDTSGNDATPQTIMFDVLLLPFDNWYNEKWSFRKLLTIDSTKVSGEHSNFPIIVDIIDSELSTGANSNGADILFTSSDGTTLLDFEIESYDSSTGDLLAWVEVANINSSTDGEIYMYYGNSEVSSSLSNSAGVWDTYEAVYHLNQEEFDSGSTVDSTYTFNGTPENMDLTNIVDGKIGNALDFDGANQRIVLGDIDLSGKNSTISAWVNSDIAQGGNVVSKSAQENHGNPWYRWNIFVDRNLKAHSRYSEIFTPTREYSLNTWSYFTVTSDGTNLIFYIDGVPVSSAGNTNDIESSDQNAVIGGRDTAFLDEFFDGQIDEVRISNTYHSPEYIATSYTNQNSPDTFISLSSEEEAPDTTGPTITNAEVSNRTVISQGNTEVFIWVTTDENATCKYSTVENEDFSLKTPMSTTGENVSSTTLSNVFDGSHTYYFNCEDSLGNIGDDYALSFDTDATTPTISNVVPEDASKINTNSITVTFDASDVNLDTVTLSFNNEEEQELTGSSGSYSYTQNNLNEGSNSYTITVNDTFGNNASQTRIVVVDTILPTIGNVLPANQTEINSTLQTISFSASDDVALNSVNLNFNGSDVTLTDDGNGNYSYEATNLEDGETYSYTITAVDTSNNQASITQVFTVAIPDETNPTIGNVLPANQTEINSTSQTISFSASDDVALSSVNLNFNGSDVTLTDDGNGNYSYEATNLEDGETYSYTITAVDTSNNQASITQVFTVAIPDETNPTIGNILPANQTEINLTSQTISFSASDDVALSSVNLNFNGSDVALTDDGNGNYSYEATNLEDGETYSYTISAVDTSSNQASITQVFIVNLPDTSKPVIDSMSPLDGAIITSNSTIISFNVTDNDLSSVILNFNGLDVTTSNEEDTYTYNATDLTNAEYTYIITAVDGTGNQETQSATFTVDIPDTTDPEIISVSPADGATITIDSVTISFNASDNVGLSTGSVNFNGGGYKIATEISMGTYEYEVTGLTDGEYSYTIRINDTSNREATATRTFTVAIPDETNPTIGNVLPANQTEINLTSQTISFSASDDVALNSVNLNFNGSDVTLTDDGNGNYSYEATNLEDGETYSYTITAVDTSSNQVSITQVFTVNLLDTSSLIITSAIPSDGETITTDTTTISFNVMGDDLTSVILNFDGLNVTTSNEGDTYTYSATDLDNRDYVYTIIAVDSLGNETNMTNTFTVSNTQSSQSSSSSGGGGSSKKGVSVGSSIQEDESLDITIGKAGDVDDTFRGEQRVSIENKESGLEVLEFEHDFKEDLNLDKLQIKSGKSLSDRNYLIVKGLELAEDKTKTVRIASQSQYVCIKDEEINTINQISRDCKGSNEYIIKCDGSVSQGYVCNKDEDYLEVSGLKHSGIIDFVYNPQDETFNLSEELSDELNEDSYNKNNENNEQIYEEIVLEDTKGNTQDSNVVEIINENNNNGLVIENENNRGTENFNENNIRGYITIVLLIISLFVVVEFLMFLHNSKDPIIILKKHPKKHQKKYPNMHSKKNIHTKNDKEKHKREIKINPEK